MSNEMRATLNDENRTVACEDGSILQIYADAGNGYYAVQGDDLVGEFALNHPIRNQTQGWFYERRDGDTFGVNCQEEFIVRDGGWTDND